MTMDRKVQQNRPQLRLASRVPEVACCAQFRLQIRIAMKQTARDHQSGDSVLCGT